MPIDKVAEDFWVMLEAGAISQTIANRQSTIVNPVGGRISSNHASSLGSISPDFMRINRKFGAR